MENKGKSKVMRLETKEFPVAGSSSSRCAGGGNRAAMGMRLSEGGESRLERSTKPLEISKKR